MAIGVLYADERAAQRAKFQAWCADPRFERFWPCLDRYLAQEEVP